MITQQGWTEIKELRGIGLSIPQVAREVGVSTTTIYRLEKLNGPKASLNKKVKRFQEILQYKEALKKLLKSGVKNIKKLHFELESLGFKGSYNCLYGYLKLNEAEFVKEYKPSTHIETQPGEEAQVDWGHFGKIEIDGVRHPLYCFVYILSYSRMFYIEFTVRQNLETLQECHKHAFKELGIPKTILYDNMKTVVLRRDKFPDRKQNIHYNPAFLEFADFYGFEVRACYPHYPRSKGKVEATVKFVRNHFMDGIRFGRDFSSLKEINEKAKMWLKNFANARKHRTTEAKPIDKWLEEKPLLRFPNNSFEYETSSFVFRNSTKDGLIQYKSNFYSVPKEFSRRKLLVKEFNNSGVVMIKIYFEDKVITTHQLSIERGKWIVDNSHRDEKESTKSGKTKKILRKHKVKDHLSIVFTRSLEYYEQTMYEFNKNI